MSDEPWRLSASAVARRIRARDLSAEAVTCSVLTRIADVNPRVNALATVQADGALAAARAADAMLARGQVVGPLHGVPVTIKINVDVAGEPTTDGVAFLKHNLAQSDSPLVASLREAGAIIVGRNNAPAFSLRWFTDNAFHGRTLNPFDAGVTPGGSSGGAAAATALGMGAIAHGNDYGGSIRYPAWACGVVGLRTTVGRIPSNKASAPNRILTNQQMSVQGPLMRTVADASVVAALDEAQPPHFEEVSAMQFQLVMNDLRRGGEAFMREHGDDALRRALGHYMAVTPQWDRDTVLEAMTRRFTIARDWAVFFERYPLLLLPNSWERPFPIDDDQVSPERLQQILWAQSPLLSTAVPPRRR